MAKTVQDNTINIFDNAIYNKGVRSKKLKQEYNQLTERIKDISHKIEYHRKNDDYAEATKLKRQQSDLENELVELDDKLNEENFKVTDEEFKEFYKAYNEEMSEFKAAHQKLTEEMNNKLKEVADIYRKMVYGKCMDYNILRSVKDCIEAFKEEDTEFKDCGIIFEFNLIS